MRTPKKDSYLGPLEEAFCLSPEFMSALTELKGCSPNSTKAIGGVYEHVRADAVGYLRQFTDSAVGQVDVVIHKDTARNREKMYVSFTKFLLCAYASGIIYGAMAAASAISDRNP